MNDNILKHQARETFQKLRQKSRLNSLLELILPSQLSEQNKLLSLYDIRKLLGDKKEERYLGLCVVPIDKIIGSEGRYQDFTRSFLPKAKHLQGRWVSIQTASQKDIILPPVQLFKAGEIYFVRDGNHRVSVARNSGAEMIDAEVTEIVSQIHVSANMTQKEILQRVMAHERTMIFRQTRLSNIIDTTHLVVTSPGSYTHIIQHIMGHKYFIEQRLKDQLPVSAELAQLRKLNPALVQLDEATISFAQAAQSWYQTLFLPIFELIQEQGLLVQFPQRTAADLYIWLVSHWHYLKNTRGQDVPLKDGVFSYSDNTAKGLWRRLASFIASYRLSKSHKKPSKGSINTSGTNKPQP